jgi:hypothetical protein
MQSMQSRNPQQLEERQRKKRRTPILSMGLIKPITIKGHKREEDDYVPLHDLYGEHHPTHQCARMDEIHHYLAQPKTS